MTDTLVVVAGPKRTCYHVPKREWMRLTRKEILSTRCGRSSAIHDIVQWPLKRAIECGLRPCSRCFPPTDQTCREWLVGIGKEPLSDKQKRQAAETEVLRNAQRGNM